MKTPLVETLLKDSGSWKQGVEGNLVEDVFGDDEEDESKELGNQGMTQKRGVGAEDADKHRVTLELQQDLFGWFDNKVEPFMKHAKPLLILLASTLR